MHTSRLGKLIVILLGAIGLLCVGGGNAHADAVNVQSSSVGNVSVSNNDLSGGTSSTVITDNHQTATSGSSKTSQATIADTTVNGTKVEAATATEFEVTKTDGTSPKSTEVAATRDNATPVILEAGTTPPVTQATSQEASKVIYYQPQRTIPSMTATDHGNPLTPASTAGGQPQPASPSLPLGTSALVSATAASSPVIKFLSSLGPIPLTRHLSLVLTLILSVVMVSAMIVSAFISFLRASGFVTAPRGSSPRINFAFPVSEFELSQRLKPNSLFRTPQLLLGSWWDQGGRINALRKEVTT